MRGFSRLPGETTDELIFRISSLRGEHPEVHNWKSVALILNELLGRDSHYTTYLRKYQGLINITGTRDAISQERIETQRNLEKERVRNRDALRETRAVIRDEARLELLIDHMGQSIRELPPLKTHVLEAPGDSEAVLLIGDWHTGAEFSNSVNSYNINILKQRVELLLAKTIDRIKSEGIGLLHVINLGDMIEGLIHVSARIESNMDAIEQTMFVSELIGNFLNELTSVVKVKFYHVLDNHSRIHPNKKDHIEKENLGHIIPWYLSTRLQFNNNVTFIDDKLDNNIGLLEVEGFKFAYVHGHLDKPKTAFPKLTKLIGSMVDFVIMGHYHSFAIHDNVIINGSLMGPNEYAYNLRLVNKPEQLMLTFRHGDVSIHRFTL